jgi:cytochrome c-type biogenesis protein CcmH
MKAAWLLAAALALANPAFADSGLPPAQWANQQLPDGRDEAEAKALMEEIRCLVCEGQSVADSDADLAGDMRHLIRTRIAAGERPEAVRGWLIERYGQWVSYRPQSKPLTWPLWILPIFLGVIGGTLLRKRIRVRRPA